MANDRKELAEYMEDAFNLTRILMSDVVLAAEIFPDVQGQSQYSRRVFLRNFFAAVEGTVYIYKQVLLRVATANRVEFKLAEQSMILEQVYRLDDRGNTEMRTAKLRTSDNVLFMLKMIAKATGSKQIEVDPANPGWKSFRSAIKLRNRVTHPRKGSEMELSREEVQCLIEATNWFKDIFLEIAGVMQKLPKTQHD